MNETIGGKAGKNDRRRTRIITKSKEEKLKKFKEQEDLKKLEKEVKKQQLKTVLAVTPIIVTGTVLKTLSGKNHIESKSPIMFNTSSEENYRNISFITTDSHNNIIEVVIKNSNEKVKPVYQNIEKLIENKKKKKEVEVLEITQDEIPLQKAYLPDDLEKIKNKEIINQYEERLKETRRELKELVFEYQVISDNINSIYNAEQLQEVLNKLNELIKKLEELQSKILLKGTASYDYSYIEDLAREYISSFNKEELVEEIKDSPLYILISAKIKELEIEKELLNLRLMDKKEDLKIDEGVLNNLKDDYNNFETFNQSLLKFQEEQESIINELREKIANSVTVQEKVQTQVRYLNVRARHVMNLFLIQSLIPGPRSARQMAALTAGYLYFARNTLRPRRITRRYRTYEVTDYTNDIENSIKEIDKSIYLLNRSEKELLNMMNEIETTYKEYLQEKEIKELLSNLENIYSSLKEKSEDLLKLKEEQEKNLQESKENNKLVKRYEEIN